MTISVQDRRLLEGKRAALEALEAYEVDEEIPSGAIEAARTVLEESIEEYDRAIRREDLTEEVREVLREPREKAGDALVQLYYTLNRRYAERRAEGETLSEQDKKIEDFLRNFGPTEFVSASFPNAMSSLEWAVDFANENMPDEVVDLSTNAMDRVQEARERLEDLSDRALAAYSNLEAAREEAKSNYLAAREFVSGALRLADRFDELNELVPPVSRVMSPESDETQ